MQRGGGITRRGSRGMYSWWKDKFRVWWNGRLGQGKGILWTYNHSGTANRAIPLSRWRMPSVRELTTIAVKRPHNLLRLLGVYWGSL